MGRVGIWAFLDSAPATVVAEAAAELDELGYGAIWVPETVGRDPLLLCAQLLAASPRIGAATGIASIYARGPLAMAAAWKTLGEAFPGRFLLGLGVSHAPMVEGVHQQPYTAPVATMQRFLDAMDAAIYTAPPPDPMPGRVLAALGPRMLALAAARTDGAHPYLVPPEHTAVRARRARRRRRSSRRSRPSCWRPIAESRGDRPRLRACVPAPPQLREQPAAARVHRGRARLRRRPRRRRRRRLGRRRRDPGPGPGAPRCRRRPRVRAGAPPRGR